MNTQLVMIVNMITMLNNLQAAVKEATYFRAKSTLVICHLPNLEQGTVALETGHP